MKLPGFRKGKVPPQVVVQRLGRDTVARRGRPRHARALVRRRDRRRRHPPGRRSDISTCGEPARPPASRSTFRFEIGVRPTAELGSYKGVEVPRREPGADDEAIDAELQQLRERMSRLETVEDAADVRRLRRDGLRRALIDGEPFDGRRRAATS